MAKVMTKREQSVLHLEKFAITATKKLISPLSVPQERNLARKKVVVESQEENLSISVSWKKVKMKS